MPVYTACNEGDEREGKKGSGSDAGTGMRTSASTPILRPSCPLREGARTAEGGRDGGISIHAEAEGRPQQPAGEEGECGLKMTERQTNQQVNNGGWNRTEWSDGVEWNKHRSREKET